jgi:hypothetical protein
MCTARSITLLSGLATAAVVVWSCDRGAPPAGPERGSPVFDGVHHNVCPVKKFTGGGRIDPPNPAPGGSGVSTMIGKVTFGFNIHADDQCNVTKGQIQVVHHPSQTKFHSVSFTRFSSYQSPEGGECGEVHGAVRVKHIADSWHEHTFGMQACDNGEPGSSPGGPDTFWWRVDDNPGGTATFGHGDTDRTRLTGGNIQAH